jgi:SAM-dependent MidA family methyltransferase
VTRPLDALLERIHRLGPVPFDEYIETVLYGEGGFYASGRGAGRRADFITSPEIGPLFGAVLARALDCWWDELGRPDPFVVVEAGAGRGSLAESILRATPACAPALRYVLVERALAQLAVDLPLEPPALVLGPEAAIDPDEPPQPMPGHGPLVTALSELPALQFTGVVLANELLDNLPFRLLERGSDEWLEVRVGEQAGTLAEVLVPVAEPPHVDAPIGGRVPVQTAATNWVRDALELLHRGRVVAIDYADTTASMARRPWTEWLRTYRGHGRGGHPLDQPGDQDVTCEVATDQLPPPTAATTQADFLRRHGIDDLVATARAAWEERAAIGDLEALKNRSRVHEGAALTDPAGLGGFAVLEWEVPA